MVAAAASPAGPPLERAREVAAIQEALAIRERGQGTLLVVHGAAGMGKTRLLEHARALAGGGAVLSARGAEFESGFPFGIVRQLLERPLAERPELGRAALGEGPAAPAARLLGGRPQGGAQPPAAGGQGVTFAIVHGVYWLVAELAATGPLLVVVDDAHWADEPSLHALAYVARRLDGLGVALLVSVRSGEAAGEGLRELAGATSARHLHLRPLSAGAAGELVGAVMGSRLDAAAAAACHAATAGNPFLLEQLAHALRSEGEPPTAQRLRAVGELAPDSLVNAIMLRLGALSAGAVEVARALAVLGDGAPLPLLAALAGLDADAAAEAVARLTRAGILSDRPAIAFVHPLVRSAVYAEPTGVERAQAHERAFELTAPGGDLERLAGHLLLAPPRGDPGRARTLQAAARLALERGSHAAAAGWLRRALAEPPAPGERAHVLLELGDAELQAGDCAAAAGHLREALTGLADPELRVQAALELSRALAAVEGTRSAIAALDAVAAGLDDEWRLRLDVERTTTGLYDAELAQEAQRRMREYAGLAGDTPAQRIALGNAALAFAFDPAATAGEAMALARRALADGTLVAEQGCEAPSVGQALYALILGGDLDRAEREVGHVLADARRRGSVFGGMYRVCHCMINIERGDLPAAIVDGEAAWRMAQELPRSPVILRWGTGIVRFLVEALVEHGEPARAQEILEQASAGLDLDAPDGNLCRYARGVLALAAGDAGVALQEFRAYGAVSRAVAYEERTSPWRLGAALAAAQLDDGAQAMALAEEELALARVWGAPGGLAAALRVRALVGEPERAADGLAGASELLAPTAHLLLRAHVLVDLGTARRRDGNRAAARAALAQGMDLAARCHAGPLAQHARDELVVLGARPRRHRISGIDALTPSERRVAALAARGLGNREIAQELFVTPKTVENHLAAVFRKLDVTSRHRLPAELTRSPGG